MKLENIQALCSLARTATGETMFGRLCIKGGKGQIMLAEGCAEAPVGIAGEFVVDPARFLAACNAAGKDADIKQNEKSVTIKGSGFRFNVRAMPADDYPWQDMTGGSASKVIIGQLSAAIAAALPFGGENMLRPDLLGVTLHNGFVYAADGPCAIRLPAAKIDGMTVDLTPGAAKLIAWRGDDPTDFCQPSDNAITFFYADGAALRLQRLAVQRPGALFKMLEFDEAGLVPIPTGLSEAISTVAGFGDGKNRWLRLNKEGITFTTEAGEANYTAGELPEAAVDSQQLIPMLKMTEKWAIEPGGKPLRFWSANGTRGMVTQVRI